MNDSVIQKQSGETKNCQAARETSRPLRFQYTAPQRNSNVPKVKSHPQTAARWTWKQPKRLIHFATYWQPRGPKPRNKPLHLTPSHFRRQQCSTQGHSRLGKHRDHWQGLLTNKHEFPDTRPKSTLRWGKVNSDLTSILVNFSPAAFQLATTLRTTSSQIVVIALSFSNWAKNLEFPDCSCSPSSRLPSGPATKKPSNSQICENHARKMRTFFTRRLEPKTRSSLSH